MKERNGTKEQDEERRMGEEKFPLVRPLCALRFQFGCQPRPPDVIVFLSFILAVVRIRHPLTQNTPAQVALGL